MQRYRRDQAAAAGQSLMPSGGSDPGDATAVAAPSASVPSPALDMLQEMLRTKMLSALAGSGQTAATQPPVPTGWESYGNLASGAKFQGPDGSWYQKL